MIGLWLFVTNNNKDKDFPLITYAFILFNSIFCNFAGNIH